MLKCVGSLMFGVTLSVAPDKDQSLKTRRFIIRYNTKSACKKRIMSAEWEVL